jgi:hypothetical protein
MNAEATTNNHTRNLVLLAGFTAGLADFLFASITRVMSGGSWMDPWKGVAGCLIGEAARKGGFAIVGDPRNDDEPAPRILPAKFTFRPGGRQVCRR